MMKSLFKIFALLGLELMAVVGTPTSLYAGDAKSSDTIGEIADITTDVGGNVKDFAESLQEFLATTKDEKALDIVVGSLEKAGLDKGWAKQIGSLKKFCKIAEKLLDAIRLANSGNELKNAWDDRAAFSEVFADNMTEYAADAVAGLVSAAVKTLGTSVIAGSTIVAPGLGTLVATGGVWLISWAAGEFAGSAFEQLAGTDLVRNGMEELAGAIWDLFHKKPDNPGGGDDPFATPPENGGGNGPMCPAPGNGGGNSGDANRYRGLKPLRLVD